MRIGRVFRLTPMPDCDYPKAIGGYGSLAVKCPKCQAENPETKQFCADCGTRLTPGGGPQISFTKTLETTTDELIRGILFAGRYEIIEELGAGGMGRV
jgi:predicted amidophosphoribosyltransferase